MDIVQRINGKLHDVIFSTNVYPNNLYLGQEEYTLLQEAVFRNMCFFGTMPGCKQSDTARNEYKGLLIFRVDADNHLNVA